MFTRIRGVRIARLENKAAILSCYSVKLFQKKECDLPVGVLLCCPLVKICPSENQNSDNHQRAKVLWHSSKLDIEKMRLR